MDTHDHKPPYIGKRKRHIIPKEERGSRLYSDRVIAPLGAWVRGHRGALNEVASRMSSYLGWRISRTQIARWLEADPNKRVEPSYGAGVVLVRVIKTMRSEYINAISPALTTGKFRIELDTLPGAGLPPIDDDGDDLGHQ